jgi:ankyrin repeat protein
VRHIGVFLEPEAFTLTNVRAIFLSLSDRYAREDILIIHAYSDATQQIEIARQYDAVQSGALRAIGFGIVEEPENLSARYFRADTLEELTYVSESGQSERLELRMWTGCDSSSDPTLDLVIGSRMGCTELVKKLLDNGADANQESRYGGCALVEAAIQGQDEIVGLLLERGADVNQTSSTGWTPLLSAVRSDHAATVGLLLSRGADANVKSEDGYTALSSAVFQKSVNLVKELLAHGADVTMKGFDGRTPLELAEEQQEEGMIRLLKAPHIRK